MHYVEVSIAGLHTGRRYYTYHSEDTVQLGQIVSVVFGRKKSVGIVRSIVKKPTFATKPLSQIYEYILPQQTILLLNWLEQFYPYDFGDLSSLFIPSNINVKERLAKEYTSHKTTELPNPTKDQIEALRIIDSNNSVLLHGDTGTGKTRVFLQVAGEVLRQGKSVLILTPEIGLTPQLEQTIKDALDYPLHTIHSKKTPAQRKRVWLEALNNSGPAIFLGPRSSLFLPYSDLGLVVVDESHDGSYKSFQSPKYHGLYVASKIANIHKAKFIQSTATPNVSDYYISTTKQIPVAKMTTIAAGAHQADGSIIDLTDRTKFTKHPQISDPLIDAMSTALSNKEQVLLFLNRRGSARIVQCNSCGTIEECQNCGIPITFHHDIHKLACHICGQVRSASSQCAECGSTDMLYFSPGTKGIEQDISSLFPRAKITRFDLDVKAKDTIARKLSEVKAGEYDIIIGTQVISKGFDLPNLSVVGVLNADGNLALPDFRSEELTFQQLYQVTGRVGRGHRKSSYFIQTRQPNNPVIETALQRNWQFFYDYELNKRKQFMFPPFAHLALLTITKKQSSTSQKIAEKLASHLKNYPKIAILGPTPSFYEASSGGSTWQILVKARSRSALIQSLVDVPSEWSIDVDPTSVL
jgi:primosomal protein N' (replication factor Y)